MSADRHSDIDQKILDYLKSRSRFTTKDSIMAGMRESFGSNGSLGESWGTFGSPKSEGHSVDISDEEDHDQEAEEQEDAIANISSTFAPTIRGKENESPLEDVQEDDDEPLKESLQESSSRNTERTSRQSTPRTPNQSTRLKASSMASPEPELVMPSMYSSDVSSRKVSPLAVSTRARMPKSRAQSRMLPSQTMTPRKSPRQAPARPSKGKSKPEASPSAIAIVWTEFLAPILRYLLSVIGYAMLHLKPVFGAILAIAVLFWGFTLVFHTSLGALTSITSLAKWAPNLSTLVPSPCSMPILSILPMCNSSTKNYGTPEFDQLVDFQSSFEEILESTASQGSILPVEMKRSEASIRDLKYVVAYSRLPSRNELVHEFDGFIASARQASDDLTRFNSRIGRAVDHIISTNKHTLQVIDGFAASEATRGALSVWFFGAKGLTDKHLLKQYLLHSSRVEDEIQRLIAEAQELKKNLDDLDDRLDAINGVAVRDGVHVRDTKDELFAQLWTKLGGNRNDVKKLDDQMQLLLSVNRYRKLASNHVGATLLKLQAISVGLEDLRERVALPETVGVREGVSLQQHIETIQLGVDRLENVRESSRALDMDRARKVLDRGVRDENLLEGTATLVK